MQNVRVTEQLLMDISHLKLLDLDFTLKGHSSSKVLKQTEFIYDFQYVFLINFSHNMLRL